MTDFFNKYVGKWGLTQFRSLPDFIQDQIRFLERIENDNLKTGDVFIQKGLLDESRRDKFLEEHLNVDKNKRRPFARWVFEQTPNEKNIQDAKNQLLAVILELPYLASMTQIRQLSLEAIPDLKDADFVDECKKAICIPFTCNLNGHETLYLGFGTEEKLKEFMQLGPQVRSRIRSISDTFGEGNTYYFLTEEDTIISELGSSSANSAVENGSKVLFEQDMKQHNVAQNWAALFNEAIKLGGTDIHCDPSILPNEDSVSIKIRVDGKLSNVAEHKSAAKLSIKHATFREMVSYLHSTTQAGEVGRTITRPVSGMVFDYENQAGVMRIKMRPEFAPLGIKDASGKELVRVVLRIWEIKDSISSLEELNVPDNIIRYIDKILKSENGLIIAAGPTGSGKSTLMGAILEKQTQLSKGSESILSFEDPIEQVSENLVQIQLTDAGRGQRGKGELDEVTVRQRILRAFLRQDPNKIFIGEVRDTMTAIFAGDIASSGHKTFATFHATSAEEALVRLSAKLESSQANLVQFFSALSCIFSTNLLASPCKKCGKKHPISESQVTGLVEKLDLNKEQVDRLSSMEIFLSTGKLNEDTVCPECSGKSVKGRVPVFGVFTISRQRKMKLLDFGDTSRFARITEQPDVDMRDSVLDGIERGDVSVQSLLDEVI